MDVILLISYIWPAIILTR